MTRYPELSRIENALAGAAAQLAPSPRRSSLRRPRLASVTVVLLALLLLGAAIAGASGAGPLAGQLDGIFGADAAPPVLSPAGEELRHALGVADSSGGRALLPASGTQHVDVYAYAKDGKVCLVVSGQGGIGHCESQLRDAGGHVSVDLGVVDGEAFVMGLAADDVSSITVSVAGHDYPAKLANSAYFAALPSQAIASHPITVRVRLRDGSQRVQHIPGLPQPAAPATR